MNNRVLITSVGRKVSLVKAFKEAGWYVIGDDIDDNSIALKYCDEIGFFSGNQNLWIPTRDAEIEEAWTYNGWPTDSIEICRDKLHFYHWCKEHGFKTPEVYFVKPRISASGKETECVWQELIEGEEYSIDLFRWDGQLISVVPRKRIKVSHGESCVTQTVELQPFLAQTEKISSGLCLVGHNTLQCFLKDSEIVWTDVNQRFGGASIVGIKAGCQSPEWLLKIVNGEKVAPRIGEYKVGLVGKSYSEWEFD